MRNPRNYGDKRQTSFCVYCGKGTETREHVPSRVLLDEPYPEELPTIYVCGPCNRGHSLDEEYVACVIECARKGTVVPAEVERDKVRRILLKKPQLAERIEESIASDSEIKGFSIEMDRFKSVLTKLARGHLLYEQNVPYLGNPLYIEFGVMEQLTLDTEKTFYEPVEISKLPEVGSRMMQRILVSEGRGYLSWLTVQPGRYRYLTPREGVALMVLSEYVWCQAVWE